jgi:hypothetical protein
MDDRVIVPSEPHAHAGNQIALPVVEIVGIAHVLVEPEGVS